jgi:type II secretory pathway component PulK
MWVLIAISGVVLLLARSMRVEAIASANRLSQIQADAIERGAEQFLCSTVDAEVATPGSTSTVSMEAQQVGDGYFWVIRPDPDDETNRLYGLTDEGGKMDLNTAPLSMLQLLPNIPADVGSSIYNWRGQATSGDGLGATDSDYEAMNPPYEAKHALFETTEELTLIRGMTTDLLFGLDKNRDGVVDTTEMQAGGATAAVSVDADSSSNRGIFPFVTAYGVKATTSTVSMSVRAVNVNSASVTSLRTVLQKSVSSGKISQITAALNPGPPARGRPPIPRPVFSSVLSFAATFAITSAELSPIYTQLTATTAGRGTATTATIAKINVNTAAKQVLICLPGFEDSDVQAIISHRQQMTTGTDPSDISWLLDAVPTNKISIAGRYLTGRSCVFSGDIVAVSPDGRAFRRYRVVIDGSKTPSYVIYRRDLTEWGWPLPADIRTAMRSGKAPPDVGAKAGGQTNSLLGKGL